MLSSVAQRGTYQTRPQDSLSHLPGNSEPRTEWDCVYQELGAAFLMQLAAAPLPLGKNVTQWRWKRAPCLFGNLSAGKPAPIPGAGTRKQESPRLHPPPGACAGASCCRRPSPGDAPPPVHDSEWPGLDGMLVIFSSAGI